MKLSIACLVASAAAQFDGWYARELDVIAAVQDGVTGDDLVLQDPTTRSAKQWHECGAKPPVPTNGQSVQCNGAFCVAVCPQGYRSQGRWKIKCKNDDTWSHSRFSPCVTCPELDTSGLGKRVEVQTIYKKNLPIKKFFCGDQSDSLDFKGYTYPNGGAKRNAKCLCRRGQNGDPAWKQSCSWDFKGNSFAQSDVDAIQCNSNQPVQPDNAALDAAQPSN